MLNYDVYQKKLKNYKKYKKEFKKETQLWEKEMLQFVRSCKKDYFLPVLGKDGSYYFKNSGDFYPDYYMSHNSLMITRSNISMIGWDQDGDKVGFVKIRLEDLFREDREEYFLSLYSDFYKQKEEKNKAEEEETERKLYERLKKKYEEVK